jgi:hypothetical protein
MNLKDLINIITISSYFFTPELFSDFIVSELEITKRQKYLIKILAYTLKNALIILKTLKLCQKYISSAYFIRI